MPAQPEGSEAEDISAFDEGVIELVKSAAENVKLYLSDTKTHRKIIIGTVGTTKVQLYDRTLIHNSTNESRSGSASY